MKIFRVVHLPLCKDILGSILVLLIIFVVAFRLLQIVAVDLFQLQLNLFNVSDSTNHINILLVVPAGIVCRQSFH